MKRITLANLADATPQEVFDHVVTHLMTQRKKSLRRLYESLPAEACVYRGEDNTMCAAGCLMTDEEYTPKIEGLAWRGVARNFEIKNTHTSLIMALQAVHDNSKVENWFQGLARVADGHSLSTNCLNTFEPIKKEALIQQNDSN
jgi:hypothetical protein